MRKALNVYLFDRLAGRLTKEDNEDLNFVYDETYISTAKALALSISLPLRTEPYTDSLTRPFFSGLLPEDMARIRLAQFLRIPEGDIFGLLAAVGGECAGALSFYPEEQGRPNLSEDGFELLTDERLFHIISMVHNRPLMAGEDGVRLSLAGVQDKLAVCLIDNQIALAKGNFPTSHILKPKIHELDATVHNEIYCMTLAKRIGLNVPRTEIRSIFKTSYYLIERYDRQLDSTGAIQRLHQEDFCQALSISPNLKYEANGGPGIADCIHLIRNHSSQPAFDIPELLQIIIFNFLIGNADAHGKNFSLLYKNGIPSLAPFYDLLSTTIYPRLSKKFAMKINGKDQSGTLTLDDWLSLSTNSAPAKRLLINQLKTMAENVQQQSALLLEESLQKTMPRMVLSKIHKTIEKRSQQILKY